ncbi:MAG: SIMPL domain-containing protein [Treponema sp.]|jgi:uncharacterized protein YggE|nr:SIMPL domain-containing protein [Treponema sp.]
MKKIPAALLCALLVLGCTKENNQSTISVIGVGTVLAQPDMIQLNISLSRISPTIRQAQEAVNTQVGQVLEILKAERLDDKNISTPSLRFSQEYEWRADRRVLIGQKAEQIMTFSVDDIRRDAERASRILDKLTEIEGLALNHINFSIKDNQELFVQSRELAYQKARDKAAQYAGLSGLKIVKTLNISEFGNAQIFPPGALLMNQKMNSAAEGSRDQSASTMLPTGELEITTQISVVFLLE